MARQTKTVETQEGDVELTERPVLTEYAGPWFPLTCECGALVLTSDEEDRGRSLTHDEHLTFQGQAPPVERQQTWTKTDEDGKTSQPAQVTVENGTVKLSVADFERLAASAGLSKA